MSNTRLIEYAKALYEADQEMYNFTDPFDQLPERIRREYYETAEHVLSALRIPRLRTTLVKVMGEVIGQALYEDSNRVATRIIMSDPDWDGDTPYFVPWNSFNLEDPGSGAVEYVWGGTVLAKKLLEHSDIPSVGEECS